MRFKTLLATFLSVVSLLFSLHAHGASVWKVTKGDNTLYLGGTLHLLSESDYPLPAAYDQAYAKSDTLVFETDLDEAATPQFQQKAMMTMTYSDGKTIKDALSAETFKALSDHLALRNIPLANLMSFKPSMVSLTLSIVELQLNGLTAAGVDQFYVNKAKADSKQLVWLETPEQQLAFLAAMGAEDEDGLIRYTLRDLKDLPQMLVKLKKAWLDGDMPGMAALSIAPFKQDYPAVYQDLLVTRNNNWMPLIVNMLNTSQTEFVLVGALHLAGEDSVLAKLQQAGYTIEQL